MTDQEFIDENKGMRGFFVLFVFILAIGVGLQTWSISWFWIALMAGALVRVAGVCAILDRLGTPRNKQEPKASEARLR